MRYHSPVFQTTQSFRGGRGRPRSGRWALRIDILLFEKLVDKIKPGDFGEELHTKNDQLLHWQATVGHGRYGR